MLKEWNMHMNMEQVYYMEIVIECKIVIAYKIYYIFFS